MFCKFAVGERAKLAFGAADRSVGQNADSACDRGSRRRVVARDHYGQNACALAILDCFCNPLTRRIFHACQPHKTELSVQRVRRQAWACALGKADHALGAVRKALQLRRSVLGQTAAVTGNHVGCALENASVSALRAVHGEHVFGLGIKRDLRHARELRMCFFDVCPVLYRRVKKRFFGRTASVVAQDACEQNSLPVAENVGHRHAVAGQRARFVRTDHTRTAERFDGRKPAHDRAPFCHARDTQGEYDRHDGGQSFGNRRDRKADAGQKHVLGRKPLEQRKDKNQGANDDRQISKQPRQLGKPLLQGRFFVACVQKGGDASHRGFHARVDGDKDSVTADDCRTAPNGVGDVARVGLGREHARSVFGNSARLARQGGFVRLKRDRFQKPSVARDDLPLGQQYDVARNDLCTRNACLFSVTQNNAFGRGNAPQRFQRVLRAAFLH